MNRSPINHSHRKETIFSYYLYLAGKFLAGNLSLEMSNYLSTLNARYFRATHADEKNAVINNLSIISQFNNNTSYSSLDPFIAFSQTVAEFLTMSAGKPDALIESVSVDGEHHIKQQQRGVIYLSAHSGNWELSAAKLVAMGYPLMVIVQPHPNPLRRPKSPGFSQPNLPHTPERSNGHIGIRSRMEAKGSSYAIN